MPFSSLCIVLEHANLLTPLEKLIHLFRVKVEILFTTHITFGTTRTSLSNCQEANLYKQIILHFSSHQNRGLGQYVIFSRSFTYKFQINCIPRNEYTTKLLHNRSSKTFSEQQRRSARYLDALA